MCYPKPTFPSILLIKALHPLINKFESYLNLVMVSSIHHVNNCVDSSAISFPHASKSWLQKNYMQWNVKQWLNRRRNFVYCELLSSWWLTWPPISHNLIVTFPFVIFLMLNPTVGIMSSLNEPDAITFTNVVFPAC